MSHFSTLILEITVYFNFILSIDPAKISKEVSLLRFCRNGRKMEYSGGNCPEGILFENKGINWDKLCVKGSWILTRKICDIKSQTEVIPYIIYSDSEEFKCFSYADLVGFGSSMYFSPIDAKDAERNRVPLLLTSNHGIILRPQVTQYGFHYTINPRINCHKNGKNAQVWILLVDPAYNFGARLNGDSIALCLLTRNYLDRNGVRIHNKGVYMYSVSVLCTKRAEGVNEESKFLTLVEGCAYEDGAEWLDVTPAELDNTLKGSRSNDSKLCEGKSHQRLIRYGQNQNQCQGVDCTETEDILNQNSLEDNIDLQSSQIGNYLLNKILKGSPKADDDEMEVDPVEIEILTKGAQIALKACDASFIPSPFYEYFLILFRALLLESFATYPPQGSLMSQNQELISEALTNCHKRTKMFDIKMEDGCWQRVTPIPRSSRTWHGMDMPVESPEKFKWSVSKDAVIEFIWKLGNFLVYHCYQDFAQGTTYHYELRAHLELMLNDELLLRWANPGGSNKMYAHLLEPHLNLEVAMTNFDSCARVAHAESKYGHDIRLKRPIDIKLQSDNRKRSTFGNNRLLDDRFGEGMNKGVPKFEPSSFLEPQNFVCIENLGTFLSKTEIPIENCW